LAFARRWKALFLVCAIGAPALLSGCGQASHGLSAAALKDTVTPKVLRSRAYSARDKECMARAMFFESNRSSREGMIAVGTTVMNRKRSGQHPDTVCGVVAEKGQFAPGVMTRKFDAEAMPDVMQAAEAVLDGERHPKLKNSMHFHTAGLKFKYRNMHYVTVAGGNAFYEKRTRNWSPLPTEDGTGVMLASAEKAAGKLRVTSRVARATAEPGIGTVDVVTASMPLPDSAPAPSFSAQPAAAVGAFQPRSGHPADIDPARFQ
jgi:hypothetical protein